MSILITPESTQIDASVLQFEGQINKIKNSPREIAEQMFNMWEEAFNALWTQQPSLSYTTQEKIDAIGTNAAELFELNTQFVAFMITNLTGKRNDLIEKIQQKINTIPPYTVNSNGTITLN
jgi:acyl-CoA reductase-like NAD-dependent aldehyde dehydrogenase